LPGASSSGAAGHTDGDDDALLLPPMRAADVPDSVREALSKGPPDGFTAEMVIGGDSKVYSIAAASIIAKVTRDRIMRLLDKKYPEYDLA